VIIRAGPGLGTALAHRFGHRGHAIGLVARDSARLEVMATELRDAGIRVSSHPADVTDASTLCSALDAAARDFGPVEVLVWAIGPGSVPITPAADVTAESAAAQFSLHVGGAVTAVQHVLPGMIVRGSGSILLATGASSVVPVAVLGDVGIAMAGLRNWALALRTAVARSGVHVATVTIATLIAPGHPLVTPTSSPGASFHFTRRGTERRRSSATSTRCGG
jgi:short-subunit dehydrogenase